MTVAMVALRAGRSIDGSRLRHLVNISRSSSRKQHALRQELSRKGSRMFKAVAPLLALVFWSDIALAREPQETESAVSAAGRGLICDDTLKTRFKPDALTSVVMVKAFPKGAALALGGESTLAAALPGFDVPVAQSDLCMVKLMVGPGNAGPAAAPSTSPGIGIEIWLPASDRWNGRVHAIGGGGWVGGWAGSPKAIADIRVPAVAGSEGAVTSITDAGHSGITGNSPSSGGDFGLNPDGSINEVLWRDFSERAIHEQAVKTKALAAAYYGRPARYAYWDGGSTGGRQGHKLAQRFPEDFDGIVANMPAINWTRFVTGMLYAQVVFQRDLAGSPLTKAQLDLVSNAAIRACDLVGGEHLGYVMDPAQCRYDPSMDESVLCKGAGTAGQPCVTPAQARAVNKIWYGMTADGSAPSPATDNGWSKTLRGGHLWYGPTRGTSLYNMYLSNIFKMVAGIADPAGPFSIASDQVAIELLDPALAGSEFRNATGNGQGHWVSLSYARFAEAYRRGLALSASKFADINTDDPDLSAFKARGGKLLVWHGLSDEMIPPQGTVQYYERVMEKMGGLGPVQEFYRLYLVPGAGHGAPNGTANPSATPPVLGPTQFYDLLTAWVENGETPDRVVITSPAGKMPAISQPICPYPKLARFDKGSPRSEASYTCR